MPASRPIARGLGHWHWQDRRRCDRGEGMIGTPEVASWVRVAVRVRRRAQVRVVADSNRAGAWHWHGTDDDSVRRDTLLPPGITWNNSDFDPSAAVASLTLPVILMAASIG